MGGVGCDGNADNRDSSLIASPEGHGELSPSVISRQGAGATHLLLQEAGTVQLLTYEGKRAEDTGTRRLCRPRVNCIQTQLQP